ncbi:hypothetical protein Tco_1437183 [Tanacetum coccineum]
MGALDQPAKACTLTKDPSSSRLTPRNQHNPPGKGLPRPSIDKPCLDDFLGQASTNECLDNTSMSQRGWDLIPRGLLRRTTRVTTSFDYEIASSGLHENVGNLVQLRVQFIPDDEARVSRNSELKDNHQSDGFSLEPSTDMLLSGLADDLGH